MTQPLAQQKGHIETLLAGMDEGIQAHLAWNQRLMRCALLHESPGEDMMQPDAHRRCIFGRWFLAEQDTLASFDAATTAALARQHQSMHDAVRALCTRSQQGRAAEPADLQTYEDSQRCMFASLQALSQRIVASAQQYDELTGLPLRNGLNYAYDIRCKDAQRLNQPLHLAMVDVDHFKKVNDVWGHSVGDQALQHLARLMTGCLRENDIVIRYGGEEFLFLLLGPQPEGVIRRLLDEVRRQPMPLEDGRSLAMTVTAGLTQVGPGDALASAIDRADRALLEGKQQGRDRYVLAPLPSV